jgi:hypothetical protein
MLHKRFWRRRRLLPRHHGATARQYRLPAASPKSGSDMDIKVDFEGKYNSDFFAILEV